MRVGNRGGRNEGAPGHAARRRELAAQCGLTGADGWIDAVLEHADPALLTALADCDLGSERADTGLAEFDDADGTAHGTPHRGRESHHEDRERSAAVDLLGYLAGVAPSSAAADAAPGGVPVPIGPPLLVCAQNETAAVNLLRLAASGGDPVLPLAVIGAVLARLVAEPWLAASPRVCSTAIGALVRIGGPDAAKELDLARKATRDPLLGARLEHAAGLARQHGADRPSRRAERKVPRHGLDHSGVLDVSVRHHFFRIVLRPGGEVAASTLDDVGAPPDEAIEHLAAGQIRSIRTAYEHEVVRLEDLLCAGTRWSFADWRELYLEHPVTRAVALGLVWRLRLGRGETAEAVPGPGGGLRAVDGWLAVPGEAPVPAGVHAVELWHPATASGASLDGWRRLLLRLPGGQPFPQITREFTRRPPAGLDPWIRDYAGQHDPDEPVAQRLDEGRWKRSDRDPARLGGAVGALFQPGDRLYSHDYPDAGLGCALPVGAAAGGGLRLGPAWFHRLGDPERRPLPLEVAPQLVYSEALRRLALAAGTRLDDGDVQDTVPGWSARGGTSIGE